MSHVLDIEAADVYRGSTRVFRRLDLRIPEGCSTAVLGPNGAGKTTLLMLLSREIYPAAGNGGAVRVFGSSRWNVWDLRSRLGIVPQELRIPYPDSATGLDVVLSGYSCGFTTWMLDRLTPRQRRGAETVLETLDITHLRDCQFAGMSSGERRLLLLGRALVNDPRALVLDEPTSGLDLRACFRYLQTIRNLICLGKTVVLVTHHIHEIPPEMARVVLLKRGEILADGDKEEIMTEDRLAELYGTGLRLLRAGGYFQAVPRERETAERLSPP
jgi:iron complex transport system ATP-binding protein